MFYKKNYFYAFCGTNHDSTIIYTLKYNIVYAKGLCHRYKSTNIIQIWALCPKIDFQNLGCASPPSSGVIAMLW